MVRFAEAGSLLEGFFAVIRSGRAGTTLFRSGTTLTMADAVRAPHRSISDMTRVPSRALVP